MTEDTNRSWKRPIVPNNPNGETDPDKIDWDTVDMTKDINWNKIEFLVVSERDGKPYLHRHPKVPQITGLGGVLAYQFNLIRFMQDHVEGGDKFIDMAQEQGALFDIARMLTNGGELPLD
jgi:hypothetical protein